VEAVRHVDEDDALATGLAVIVVRLAGGLVPRATGVDRRALVGAGRREVVHLALHDDRVVIGGVRVWTGLEVLRDLQEETDRRLLLRIAEHDRDLRPLVAELRIERRPLLILRRRTD